MSLRKPTTLLPSRQQLSSRCSKPRPLEGIDDAVLDADPAPPFGRAVAVLDARAAPAQADLAVGIAQLLLQIALPERAVVIEGDDLVPARIAEEAVADRGRARNGRRRRP